MLLDPFYRTLNGFCILICKEWLSFGHQFNTRLGHALEKPTNQVSPVFLQWLDCVWQLLNQFPMAFEFNSRVILQIANHIYSCRFGTFLGNHECERGDFMYTTRSLWEYLLDPDLRRDHTNPLYDPSVSAPCAPPAFSQLTLLVGPLGYSTAMCFFPQSQRCLETSPYGRTTSCGGPWYLPWR
ncbi:MTMR8 [Symbiodinium sp. KB8]|nr:MTMR8 [Symbiodinium sp. KB8]